MHDLVVRGGRVADGTGSPAVTADVAIDGDRITEVGRIEGRGRRELVADGLLVTPGWVDIHTHYDGQATWDPLLTPSFWHGVTTAVMGNCGVGFAPAKPDRHEWLIGLMEGVEDIPGSALADGITWGWESFPEYLDRLDAMPRAIDIATQVPHGAVRAYAMGERGARNEAATPEDLEAMATIVREGIVAGGLGFSSSRTLVHRAVDGEPVPGTFAADDELLAMAEASVAAGSGLFEVAPAGVAGEDILAPERELAWMHRVSADTGATVTFLVSQYDQAPDLWREMFRRCEVAAADGARLVPQVLGRPLNALFGHQATLHPFVAMPTYMKMQDLALPERVARLRQPAIRARLLTEEPSPDHPLGALLTFPLERVFPLGDPPDYEPPPERSIAALAAAERRPAKEVLYDLMLEDEGRELLMWPALNYHGGDAEPVREMLLSPLSVLGGGDGGAHCGTICDASTPTTMLTHWARDRTRGARLPLEFVVSKQTRDTARAFGLNDRGELRSGAKADLNVIDYEGLTLPRPEMVHDLPAGARRFSQRARGYVATVVSGEVVLEHDEATGARPGRLVRRGSAELRPNNR